MEYWYPYDLKEKKALTWEEYRAALTSGRKDTEFHLSTRYTAVFNAGLVEGMPEQKLPKKHDIQADALIGTLSKSMGVPIFYDGGDQAFYSPSRDEIHLPAQSAFETQYAFNSTALHELSHSTGHPARLNRPPALFSDIRAYACEELVAEMSSCFLGAELTGELDPRHIENHKAYVQSWIQAIREKPDTLVRAIRDAQSAADYMDWKAGLISEKEYLTAKAGTMELPVKARSREQCER